MSVTVCHPEYEARQNEWRRIAAVLAGRDAVVEAGEEFVPMLGGQDGGQYNSYLLRGLWFGATQRTRKGIVGLVFSQSPQVSVPISIEPFLEDITLTDVSLQEFAKEVFSEVVAYNWGGVLVDVSPNTTPTLATDNRPYFSFYHAFNVRWWKRERINGKLQPTCVILREEREDPIPDEDYGSQMVVIYRVLKLTQHTDEKGRTFWAYIQEEWEQATDPKDPFNKDKKWRLMRVITPQRKDQSLNFIPFTFMTTEGNEPHICKSDLLDLADMNIDHWRLTVDLRHGLHFTALPTPCASSVPDGLELRIGSETAWTSSSPDFKAWFLEYSGAGIGSIQEAIERDEHLMALLGSRLLETQKRASETAEAMVIRQAGEDSVVMSAARSVEKGIEKALWHMAYWVGEEDPKTSVSLTGGLNDLMIGAQDMVVMFKAVQAGLLSEQAWIEAMIRKNWVRGVDWEEEAKRPRIDLPDPKTGVSMDRNTITTGMGVTNDSSLELTTD